MKKKKIIFLNIIFFILIISTNFVEAADGININPNIQKLGCCVTPDSCTFTIESNCDTKYNKFLPWKNCNDLKECKMGCCVVIDYEKNSIYCYPEITSINFNRGVTYSFCDNLRNLERRIYIEFDYNIAGENCLKKCKDSKLSCNHEMNKDKIVTREMASVNLFDEMYDKLYNQVNQVNLFKKYPKFREMWDIFTSDVKKEKPLYSDLNISDYSFEAVQKLTKAGIISGYPDGTFKPNRKITRAEAIVMILKATVLKIDPNFINNSLIENVELKDVSKDHWAYKYLQLAKYLGIIKGYYDETIKPNNDINCDEFINIFFNAFRFVEFASEKEITCSNTNSPDHTCHLFGFGDCCKICNEKNEKGCCPEGMLEYNGQCRKITKKLDVGSSCEFSAECKEGLYCSINSKNTKQKACCPYGKKWDGKECVSGGICNDPKETDCYEKWWPNEVDTDNICHKIAVCSPVAQEIANEAIECCKNGCKGNCHELCNVAYDESGIKEKFNELTLKRCEGLYVLYGFGGAARWMKDYFYPPFCCIKENNEYDEYCVNNCLKSDYGICRCSNYDYGIKTEILKCDVSGWYSDTDLSVNGCIMGGPIHAHLDIIKSGVCIDYSHAVTTVLRTLGYKSDEVMSVYGKTHAWNLVKLPGERKYYVVDTTGNIGPIKKYYINNPFEPYCKELYECLNEKKISCPKIKEIYGCD